LNNSNSYRQNRILREKERMKRKIIIRLLGKEKIDRRTAQNLLEIFNYISYSQRFTGPEITKNKRIRGSVLYLLIKAFIDKRLVQKVGEKPSAGALGSTAIYTLTTQGKILSAYVTGHDALFRTAMDEMITEERNPLKCFCLEALKENFETESARMLLEHSIRRAETMITKGLGADTLMSELIGNAFSLISFTEPDTQLFKKNATLIERSKYRGALFQFFKMQIESDFFLSLSDDKFSVYANSLKENPELLHIPCQNPECLNVVKLDSFLKIAIPQYCEKCAR